MVSVPAAVNSALPHHSQVAIDGKSIEKKKKKKKKQSVDVPEAAADTQKGKKDEFFADEDPSDGKKPDGAKKQKKDKKRKHADENGAALQPEADGETPEATQKDKTLKKKKKKREEAQHDGAIEDAAAAENAPEKKKSKLKPKKGKTSGKEVHPAKVTKNGSEGSQKASRGPAGRAAVGDAELATTGAPLMKHTYREHPDVTAMSEEQLSSFLKERQIAVEASPGALDGGKVCLRPITSFDQSGLGGEVLQAVRGFKAPSPIQSQAWPLALQGLDMIGIAATGSGKTIAFGVPALQHILTQQRHAPVATTAPRALVMAPTRELAQQITAEFDDKVGSRCGVGAYTVFGGMPKRSQAAELLQKQPAVIVGTPGRTLDFIEDGTISMQDVSFLVLDEADRMLDQGFEDTMRAIVGYVRSDRQTLMFSATWPPSVQKLALEFLVNPVKVTIGAQDLAASHSISQTVHVIEEYEKDTLFGKLLAPFRKNGHEGRIMVFVLYKKEAPRVERLIRNKGIQAASIHGDMSQEARNAAAADFKSGKVPLLVATDVAARGLDIPDVEVVINYSFPLTVEDYVHRIGRTGRAGKTGIAHTLFVGKHDKAKAGELVNVLREAGQDVPKELMAFGTAVKKKESKLYGAHFKEVDMSAKATKVTFDSDDD